MDEATWGTTDLGLAAALICSGFTMTDISRDEKGRATFQFIDEISLEHGINAYWDAGSLTVEAREYFDTIKMLKGRIYAGK